ncbi:hypothetical protein LTR10_000821 [Elasticomyces elasticus]|nr:hypothetical protein LTR10_000821 [Elasticomyces elasticus]KAK4979933.1 hypothetical protein LTR42_000240 [Elasticomyces elasticus]
MAEQLAAELLERLYQSERANLDLKIRLHASHAELKAVQDQAFAAETAHSDAMGAMEDKLTADVFKEQMQVAELEKAIEDMKTQEPSKLAAEVAEVKEILKTAMDLKATPEPPSTAKEQSESEFSRAVRQMNQRNARHVADRMQRTQRDAVQIVPRMGGFLDRAPTPEYPY